MKKVYLLAPALLLGAMSFGQTGAKPLAASAITTENVKAVNAAPAAKALGVEFFNDDFSNPANWTVDNSGQTGPTFGWTLDATRDGWYQPATKILNSSGGNFAELTNGNAQNGDQALGVDYYLTTANPIPLSLGTNVSLEFKQWGARFNDLQEIMISTDGTNFTAVGNNNNFAVLSASGGSAYPNPSIKTINLGTQLQGASQVWIRFHWTTNFPNSASNPNVWITYGWLIDDVRMVTNPDNDLSISSSYYGSEGLFYYQIPNTQVAPIDFSAQVFNGGSNVQSNVKLNVDVNSGLYTSASAPATIASLATDSLFTTTQFTPAGNATYTVTRTITSDSIDDVPTNNVFAPYSFSVGDYIYARDNNTPSGSQQNGTDGYEAGPLFDIFADQTLGAVDIRLAGGANGTATGTEVNARLYEVAADFTLLSESAPIYAAAANLNNWTTFELDPPVTLEAGKTYLVTANSYSGTMRVSNGGTSAQQTSFFLDHSDETWYFTTNTPMVRMNFDPSLSIAENNASFGAVNVYPNPAVNTAEVSFNLKEASNVAVTVTDLTGKVVYTTNVTNATIGANSVALNVADFSNGMYYVNLATEGSVVTRKFIKK